MGRTFGVRLLLGGVLVVAACSSSDGSDGSAGPGFAPAELPVASSEAPAGEAPAAETPEAEDATSLAHRIAAAESTVRDPAAPADRRADAARSAQADYRLLERRPDWDVAVFGALPPPLADVVRRNVEARRSLAAMHRTWPTTVPAWRIVDPPPAAELRGYYDEAQARFGVPWEILAGVNLVETGFGRIVGLSTAGAQGPMQFLPATWARYGLGGDVWNPRDAILGAANYLAANGGAGGLDNPALGNALYRYNNDERYGRAVREYAAVMRADPLSFDGYHAWQIYYRTDVGDIVLPTGYEESAPVPVREWQARQPR